MRVLGHILKVAMHFGVAIVIQYSCSSVSLGIYISSLLGMHNIDAVVGDGQQKNSVHIV